MTRWSTTFPSRKVPVVGKVGTISLNWINTAPTFTSQDIISHVTGGILYIQGSVEATSAGSGDAGFTLPGGYTVPTNLLKTAANTHKGNLGGGSFHNADGGPDTNVVQAYASDASTIKFAAGVGGGGNFDWASLGSGHVFAINLKIPIAELAGQGTNDIGANEVEYVSNDGVTWDADNTTSFVTGVDGAAIPDSNLSTMRTKRVRFSSPIQDTDQIVVEFKHEDRWVPAIGSSYPGQLWGVEAFRYAVGSGAAGTVGVGYRPITGNNTDIDIVFGRFTQMYFSGGVDTGVEWGSALPSGGIRWRVVKHSAGIPVNFGLGSPTSAGLVKTNTGATTSVVGEYEEDSGSLDGDFSSGTYKAVRIGSLVTLTIKTYGFTSDTSSVTTTTLPTSMRPDANTRNLSGIGSNRGVYVIVNSTGTFGMSYVLATDIDSVVGSNDTDLNGEEYSITYTV